ncbi:hypothetical protein HDU76_006636 [Blyttiomyces sp. JEL0837]|nr:hypothetical protein HDU76_006636 [Blyttiomyces sp. JEL0837]
MSGSNTHEEIKDEVTKPMFERLNTENWSIWKPRMINLLGSKNLIHCVDPEHYVKEVHKGTQLEEGQSIPEDSVMYDERYYQYVQYVPDNKKELKAFPGTKGENFQANFLIIKNVMPDLEQLLSTDPDFAYNNFLNLQ